MNYFRCFAKSFRYTAEDGFEISVPSENAVDLTKVTLEKSRGKIRLTGLGARDSLRLEAVLCSYGNDIQQHTTPVKAGLSWAIGKRRKAEGGFLGAEVILKRLKDGPKVRRVGFVSSGLPSRSHSEIQDGKWTSIWEITSGVFSPCLKKNIAMGYVKSGSHKAGTKVKLIVRGKAYDGVVTIMPFVPTICYKPSYTESIFSGASAPGIPNTFLFPLRYDTLVYSDERSHFSIARTVFAVLFLPILLLLNGGEIKP